MTSGRESKGSEPAGRVDTATASMARVNDALLGGKDNFRVDRDVRDNLLAADPEFGRASRDRIDFIMRATRYLVGEAGIRQFLDCASALPETENIHDAAQRVDRECTTVYVSRDATVLAHARALLDDNDRTHVAAGDYREPRQVLENPVVTKHLDFTEPMAVFHMGTVLHMPPEHDTAGMIETYVQAMPSGSYLVFGALLDPGPEHELTDFAAVMLAAYRQAGNGGWLRTRDELLAMLSGVDLIEPGLVIQADWWPDGPRQRPLGPTQRLAVGAVGRKP
jgi:S-adenosyl methyltransferase